MAQPRSVRLGCTGDIVVFEDLSLRVFYLFDGSDDSLPERTCVQIASRCVPLCEADVLATVGRLDGLYERLAICVERRGKRSLSSSSHHTVRCVLDWSIRTLRACNDLMHLLHNTEFREGDPKMDLTLRELVSSLIEVLSDVQAARYGATPLLVMAVMAAAGMNMTLAALLQGRDMHELSRRGSLFFEVLKLIRVASHFPDLAQLLATPSRQRGGQEVSVLGCLTVLARAARVVQHWNRSGTSAYRSTASQRAVEALMPDMRKEHSKIAGRVLETYDKFAEAVQAVSEQSLYAASAPVQRPSHAEMLDQYLRDLRENLHAGERNRDFGVEASGAAASRGLASASYGVAPYYNPAATAAASAGAGMAGWGGGAAYGDAYSRQRTAGAAGSVESPPEALYGVGGGWGCTAGLETQAARNVIEAMRIEREMQRLQQGLSVASSGALGREGRDHRSLAFPEQQLTSPTNLAATSTLAYPWNAQSQEQQQQQGIYSWTEGSMHDSQQQQQQHYEQLGRAGTPQRGAPMTVQKQHQLLYGLADRSAPAPPQQPPQSQQPQYQQQQLQPQQQQAAVLGACSSSGGGGAVGVGSVGASARYLGGYSVLDSALGSGSGAAANPSQASSGIGGRSGSAARTRMVAVDPIPPDRASISITSMAAARGGLGGLVAATAAATPLAAAVGAGGGGGGAGGGRREVWTAAPVYYEPATTRGQTTPTAQSSVSHPQYQYQYQTQNQHPQQQQIQLGDYAQADSSGSGRSGSGAPAHGHHRASPYPTLPGRNVDVSLTGPDGAGASSSGGGAGGRRATGAGPPQVWELEVSDSSGGDDAGRSRSGRAVADAQAVRTSSRVERSVTAARKALQVDTTRMQQDLDPSSPSSAGRHPAGRALSTARPAPGSRALQNRSGSTSDCSSSSSDDLSGRRKSLRAMAKAAGLLGSSRSSSSRSSHRPKQQLPPEQQPPPQRPESGQRQRSESTSRRSRVDPSASPTGTAARILDAYVSYDRTTRTAGTAHGSSTPVTSPSGTRAKLTAATANYSPPSDGGGSKSAIQSSTATPGAYHHSSTTSTSDRASAPAAVVPPDGPYGTGSYPGRWVAASDVTGGRDPDPRGLKLAPTAAAAGRYEHAKTRSAGGATAAQLTVTRGLVGGPGPGDPGALVARSGGGATVSTSTAGSERTLETDGASPQPASRTDRRRMPSYITTGPLFDNGVEYGKYYRSEEEDIQKALQLSREEAERAAAVAVVAAAAGPEAPAARGTPGRGGHSDASPRGPGSDQQGRQRGSSSGPGAGAELALDDSGGGGRLVGGLVPLTDLHQRYALIDPLLCAKLVSLEDDFTRTRRVAGDGNCFYRAALFALMEHVLAGPDGVLALRLEEVFSAHLGRLDPPPPSSQPGTPSAAGAAGTGNQQAAGGGASLGERVSGSLSGGAAGALPPASDAAAHRGGRQLLRLLRTAWFKAIDALMPADVSSLEQLFNHSAHSADVIRFARSLTVHELVSAADFYTPFIPGCGRDYEGLSLRQICEEHVLPLGREVEQLQIIALCTALGATVAVLDVAGSQVGAIKHGPAGHRGPPVAWVAHLPGHYDVIYPARPLDVAPGGALIPAKLMD